MSGEELANTIMVCTLIVCVTAIVIVWMWREL